MTVSKKSSLLPLILLIVLCLALSAIVYDILRLHRAYTAYVPYYATPAPTATQKALSLSPSPETTARATFSPVPAADATPEPAARQFNTDTDRFWTEGALTRLDDYRSPTLSVRVDTVVDSTTFSRLVTYYVADIYVSDVTAVRTASCKGDFSRTGHGSVEQTAKNVNALVAISGDYYGFHRDSLVIRNGEIYRKSIRDDMDVCLLLRDGTMETYRANTITVKAILEKDPWQAWQFGPALIKSNGAARTAFPDSTILTRNPRSCIGYVDPGHYLFVVVDGRQKHSKGLTLKELAVLMTSLGCKQAFNLDGGASAHFYWKDTVFNSPSKGGRPMSDIIYIAKEDYPASPYHHGKDGIDP